MVFNKNHFSKQVCGPRDPLKPPPPFMANAILNFHFDFLNTSLNGGQEAENDPAAASSVGMNYIRLEYVAYMEEHTWRVEKATG